MTLLRGNCFIPPKKHHSFICSQTEFPHHQMYHHHHQPGRRTPGTGRQGAGSVACCGRCVARTDRSCSVGSSPRGGWQGDCKGWGSTLGARSSPAHPRHRYIIHIVSRVALTVDHLGGERGYARGSQASRGGGRGEWREGGVEGGGSGGRGEWRGGGAFISPL